MSAIQDEVFIISALYKVTVTEQQAGDSNKHQRSNATHIWKTLQFSRRKIIRAPINHSAAIWWSVIGKSQRHQEENINPKILPNFMSGLEQKLRRSLIFLIAVLVIYLLILTTLHLMTRRNFWRSSWGQEINVTVAKTSFMKFFHPK